MEPARRGEVHRDLARGMSGDLTAEGRIAGGGRFVLVLPKGSVDPDAPVALSGEVVAIGKRN